MGPGEKDAFKDLLSVIDGKEHKKVTDSKMGPGEKDAFKDLLSVIESKNQWHYKMFMKIFRQVLLIGLKIFVFITEKGRVV
jgi:hypothetical protein